MLLGNGVGGFSVAASPAVQDGPAGIASADMNEDGKPDLAVSSRFSSLISVLLNTTLPPVSDTTAPVIAPHADVVAQATGLGAVDATAESENGLLLTSDPR